MRARSVMPLLAAAGEIAATDEFPPKARKALADAGANFARWTRRPQGIFLIPSWRKWCSTSRGYTDMLKADKSAEAPGRLENLKELVRSMEEFESLAALSSNTCRWSWRSSRTNAATAST